MIKKIFNNKKIINIIILIFFLIIILITFFLRKAIYKDNINIIKKNNISKYTKITNYIRTNQFQEQTNFLYVGKETNFYIFCYLNKDTVIFDTITIIKELVNLESNHSDFLNKTGIIKTIYSKHGKQVSWDNFFYDSYKTDSTLKWNFTKNNSFKFSSFRYNNIEVDKLKASSFFIWGTINKLKENPENNILYKYKKDSSSIIELSKINMNDVYREWNNFVKKQKQTLGEIKITNSTNLGFSININGKKKEVQYNKIEEVILPNDLLDILKGYESIKLSWDSNKFNSVNYIGYLNLTINGSNWINFIKENKNITLKEFVLKALILQIKESKTNQLILNYYNAGEQSYIIITNKNNNSNYLLLLLLLLLIAFIGGIISIINLRKYSINKNLANTYVKKEDNNEIRNIFLNRTSNIELDAKINYNNQLFDNYYLFKKNRISEELIKILEKIDSTNKDIPLNNKIEKLNTLYKHIQHTDKISSLIAELKKSDLINPKLKAEIINYQDFVYNSYSSLEVCNTFKLFSELNISLNENMVKKIKINELFLKNLYKKHIVNFNEMVNDPIKINTKEFKVLLIEISTHIISYIKYIIDDNNNRNKGNVKIVLEEITVDDLEKKYRTIFDSSNEKHHYSFVINIKNLLHELEIKKINFLLDGFDINNELAK